MTNKELENIVKEYTAKQRRFLSLVVTRKDIEIEKIFEEHNKEVEKIFNKFVKGKYREQDAQLFLRSPDALLAKELNNLSLSLQNSLYAHVTSNIMQGFKVATDNFSDITNAIFPNTLSNIKKEYSQINDKAVSKFINRDIQSGRTLKGRCWLLSKQYLRDVNDTIAIGISKGDSAVNIGKRLRLFIEDIEAKNKEIAQIEDSKLKKDLQNRQPKPKPHKRVTNVKYHCEMLARNETNLAYRNAEQDKFDSLDQVVGFRIQVSNSHLEWLEKYWRPRYGDEIEVCDAMAGDYPKWFRWNGWHVSCKDIRIPILKTQEELAKDIIKLTKGEKVDNNSVNKVASLPNNALLWIKSNYNRISGYSNPPYWWVDNIETINKIMI